MRLGRIKLLQMGGMTLTLIVCGCAERMATGGTDVEKPGIPVVGRGEGDILSCLAFEPISWSNQDSDETIRLVKRHNRVWTAYCR